MEKNTIVNQLMQNLQDKVKMKKKTIYTTFVRPVLDQSAPVWSSSLRQENSSDLKRVQKIPIKIIMSRKYKTYESALKQLI